MQMVYLFSSFGLMLLVAACFYRWFVAPRLARLPPELALQALLAIHCFRAISPISLIAGVTTPGLSEAFTYPQVLGDAGTAVFALIAIAALRSRRSWAMPWVWFTNIFGFLDLGIVLVQGLRYGFAEHVGGMFYVVVWLVPWLLVSHVAIFARLMRGDRVDSSQPEALSLRSARN